MVLKTFNLNESIYSQYSAHCKKHGISMSKQVERFIADEVAKIQQAVVGTPSSVLNSLGSSNTSSHPHPMKKFC